MSPQDASYRGARRPFCSILKKDGETYVTNGDLADSAAIEDAFWKQAEDPYSPLNGFDAAVRIYFLRERIGTLE